MSIDVFPATVLNSTLWNGQTYEEGTFTVTATGFTTAVTGTATYRRVGALVSLRLSNLSGTSNATTFTITGIPAVLWAAAAAIYPQSIQDNSVHSIGIVTLPTAGTINVYKDAAATGFVASGAKSLLNMVLTYPLASALAAPGWTGQSYEEGSFTVTGTGFTTPPTGTARYVRVGKQVTCYLPALTGTSNATTFGITGWPAALIPPASFGDVIHVVRCIDNTSVGAAGLLVFAAAGGVTLRPNATVGSGFTASGTKTLSITTLTYLLG